MLGTEMLREHKTQNEIVFETDKGCQIPRIRQTTLAMPQSSESGCLDIRTRQRALRQGVSARRHTPPAARESKLAQASTSQC